MTTGGERVVWHHDWSTLPEGRKLGGFQGNESGWGVVPDAVLATRAAVILYLDLAAYEDAVRGLPPEEVERAVLHRREVFRLTSNDVGRVLDAVHSAMAHAAKTGEDELFARLAPIAVDLWEGGRFAHVDMTTLVVVALDSDARAFAEARDLPLGQDAADLERRYKLDAETMAALGRPQYTRGLLHVSRPRLCRFAPMDEVLHADFHDEKLVLGPDWIVGAKPDHYLDAVRDRGKLVDLLAFDSAPLAGWVLETAAQVERDVGAAVDRAHADLQTLAKSYGRGVRFRQYAVRVRLASRLTGNAIVGADDVVRDVELEQTQLLDLYARSPDGVTASLDAALDRARIDAAFFATRSELSATSRRRWTDVVTALSQAKTDQP